MKLKIKDINPNPFKKEINEGKLNQEQIDKIKANMKKLGFMGSLPVFKKNNKYYLISGHHRKEALKQIFGKEYEVEINIKEYNEDQIFRGMVIENLTQRSGEYREENDNIVAIEKYLNEHLNVLRGLRNVRKPLDSLGRKNKGLKTEHQNKAVARDIGQWLDEGNEKIISHDTITNHLNIYHKVDKDIQEKISKTHDKTREERDAEETINYSQAVLLSTINDKTEQKDIAKVLKESKEQRVREQGKLLTQYKEAPEDIKQKIRTGEIDIADIQESIIEYNVSDHKNKHEVEQTDERTVFIPNFESMLNDFSLEVDRLERHINIFSKIFGDKQFRNKYKKAPIKVRTIADNIIVDIERRINNCWKQVELFKTAINETKEEEQKLIGGK